MYPVNPRDAAVEQNRVVWQRVMGMRGQSWDLTGRKDIFRRTQKHWDQKDEKSWPCKQPGGRNNKCKGIEVISRESACRQHNNRTKKLQRVPCGSREHGGKVSGGKKGCDNIRPYYGHSVCDLLGHDNHLGFYFKCSEKLLKCLDIDIGWWQRDWVRSKSM